MRISYHRSSSIRKAYVLKIKTKIHVFIDRLPGGRIPVDQLIIWNTVDESSHELHCFWRHSASFLPSEESSQRYGRCNLKLLIQQNFKILSICEPPFVILRS
jgi:hypothetical protein